MAAHNISISQVWFPSLGIIFQRLFPATSWKPLGGESSTSFAVPGCEQCFSQCRHAKLFLLLGRHEANQFQWPILKGPRGALVLPQSCSIKMYFHLCSLYTVRWILTWNLIISLFNLLCSSHAAHMQSLCSRLYNNPWAPLDQDLQPSCYSIAVAIPASHRCFPCPPRGRGNWRGAAGRCWSYHCWCDHVYHSTIWCQCWRTYSITFPRRRNRVKQKASLLSLPACCGVLLSLRQFASVKMVLVGSI